MGKCNQLDFLDVSLFYSIIMENWLLDLWGLF